MQKGLPSITHSGPTCLPQALQVYNPGENFPQDSHIPPIAIL
jgi:hypothetical protein